MNRSLSILVPDMTATTLFQSGWQTNNTFEQRQPLATNKNTAMYSESITEASVPLLGDILSS